MTEKIVYVVHAVDAEGPLAEEDLSLWKGTEEKTDWWKRPDFGSSVTDLWEFINRHRASTLGSWEQIVSMLRVSTSEKQRRLIPDSFGGGWVYNWFCMDHVGYWDNPRRRSMGIHTIFDFYSNLVREQQAGDSVHWHFHPMSTYREAHKCATSFLNSPEIYEILCCRLLDRGWFPRANRAGFHDERPDSHWFLEQWIPFDFSNTSSSDIDEHANPDIVNGRFGDWRWAPRDWRTYHPSHDCYQLEGTCRRKIARCLNVLNRFANINEEEVGAGFERAASGRPTLLGIATHDWRDLNVEVEYVRYLLCRVAPHFPEVKFKYSEAVEAFNAVHPPKLSSPLVLDCRLIFDDRGRPVRLDVKTLSGKIFGPQPFLAIRSRSRRLIHDNFNYGTSLSVYHYSFDDQSVLPEDVQAVGVAANDAGGKQSIHVVEIDAVPVGTRELSL